jgi:hypothetical protein
LRDPIWKKDPSPKERADGVAQGVGPEFKPHYCKKKKKKWSRYWQSCCPFQRFQGTPVSLHRVPTILGRVLHFHHLETHENFALGPANYRLTASTTSLLSLNMVCFLLGLILTSFHASSSSCLPLFYSPHCQDISASHFSAISNLFVFSLC